MNRLKRSKTLYLVIGILSFIGISTVFAYSIFADEIGFRPLDNERNVEDVDESLNDLHLRVTELCNNSPYNYLVTPKPSANTIVLKVDDNGNHFKYFYCGIDGDYAYLAVDGYCKIPNVEPQQTYNVVIAGLDNGMDVKKRAFTITTPNNYIMDYNFLNSGSTQGSVTITSNNPDGTYGLSITGTSDLRNYNGASRATFIEHYRKWYKQVDLSNFNELTFYARKGSNHGNIMIDIDDTELLNKNYSAIDSTWVKYTIDLSTYTGLHTLTIAGGYSDYTGSASSNTQYYHIELK